MQSAKFPSFIKGRTDKDEVYMSKEEEKCYCLEIFKKIDENIQIKCLKERCGRYRIEKRKENEQKSSSN